MKEKEHAENLAKLEREKKAKEGARRSIVHSFVFS